MAYSDIQHQDFEELLDIYTVKYENGRYDIINHESLYDAYNNQDINIHSFNYNGNGGVSNLKRYYYNYYNTYRRDISPDDYVIKLNETSLSNNINILNNNYYNIDNNNFTSDSSNLFNFKGISINYNFACNGALATLEDIFAEYGYDYIVAKDQELLKTLGIYYYFDRSAPYNLEFAYEILPIGDEYIDEDGNVSIIEYDGTTIPNVSLLISGMLYIVIKSNNLKPRKIYFNNDYIPSLFVNDDKYNEKSIYNRGDDNYKYILTDSQPMKLCDINRYRSWGYSIQWLPSFIVFHDQYKFEENNNDINFSNINIKFDEVIPDEYGIALFISSILINYSRENYVYGLLGSLYDSLKHEITDYDLTNAATLTFAIYKFPFKTSTDTAALLTQFKFGEKPYYSFNKNGNAKWSENYPCTNEFTYGPVMKAKSESDKATLQVNVVPALYIKDYSINNELVSVLDSDTTDIVLNRTENKTTYINPYLNNTDTSVYVIDSSNIFSDIYEAENTINNILDDISYEDFFNSNGNKTAVGQLNMEIIKNVGSIPVVADIHNENNIFNGISLVISKIPSIDMHNYELKNGIIDIAFSNISLNITLNNSPLVAGFFIPADDPTTSGIYAPVFAKYIE